jgi:hypothetical protein
MCATLPITGFLIWWGKKKKSKKKAKKTIVSSNKNKVMQPSRTQVQQEEQVS